MWSLDIFFLNWIFLLALIPVSFVWLRRAWKIFFKRDFSEVALKRGVPPANAEKYAPYEFIINFLAGIVLVGVLVSVLGFQAMAREDWIATAGVTLWMKIFASLALRMQAHGFGSGKKKAAQAKEASSR
ncbi:hypothetical protein [Hydrogenophaga sp. 5NK40-0174]|uniref:hypothetical protein n=1 Tax=Hydrogenophaga sp. 5NK40-0174 TaxID=3127649 RepID=UPI00310710EE